ncbi:hypothetical protein, partial [Lactococcus cremoris]|uniref:hypothetical protein n=1 Tax=Lactococcus lactis subsp. cremoris TaxID=1359 RepID=UPI001A9A3C59
MVLKLLAILPSGSAGKFLKKIWNLEKMGGEEAIFASVLRPPLVGHWSKTKSCLPKPLVLKDFFYLRPKKKTNWQKRLNVY